MAKSKSTKKEEVKVVDEVTIEETVVEETIEETVAEEAPVEEAKEEIEVEIVIEEPKAEKVEGKGKVVKLTQRTALFEDGTLVRFNGRKEHKKYSALR